MKNWMRVVLPPGEYIAIFVFAYLSTLAVNWLLYFTWLSELGVYQLLFPFRDGVVLTSAGIYGIFRGYTFHPACRADYSDFLKQTAWTPKKPLLLGPIHLVWQDSIVLFVLLAAIWPNPYFHPLMPFYWMMLGYLLGLIPPLQACHAWRQIYVIGFGIGVVILFWSNPFVFTAVLIALYGIAHWGIRFSLEELHRTVLEETVSAKDANIQHPKLFGLERIKHLSGWPFDALASRKPTIQFRQDKITSIPILHGMLISLLVGWSAFCVIVPFFQLSEIPYNFFDQQLAGNIDSVPEQAPGVVNVLTQEIYTPGVLLASKESGFVVFYILLIGGFLISIQRLISYCDGHSSPINLWGRLRTFRWIIPEYDKVFVSPVCILVVAFCFYPALNYLGLPPLLSGPFSLTLMMLASLLIGPNRVKWQLTSPCRLTKPAVYRGGTEGHFTQL